MFNIQCQSANAPAKAEQQPHQPNRDEWRQEPFEITVLGPLFAWDELRCKRESKMLDAASTGDWIVTGGGTGAGRSGPLPRGREKALDLGPLRRPGRQAAQELGGFPGRFDRLAGPEV